MQYSFENDNSCGKCRNQQPSTTKCINFTWFTVDASYGIYVALWCSASATIFS